MRPRSSIWLRWAVALVLGWSAAADGPAQVKAPPPPGSYAVTVRYRIRADRDGRIVQYREMEKNLAAAGFKPADPDVGRFAQFDPAAELLTGTVPGASATKLLDDPRVKTILLAPAGYTAPEGPDTPVQIQATLSGNLPATEQRVLHDQAVARLARMGFRENVGYDHAGYTRVRGSVPAKVVPSLVKDLRNLPTGWFAADVPRDETTLPFRGVNPIRVVEVLPAAPDATATLPPDPPPGKITADARAALAANGTRLELVLAAPLDGSSREIRDRIRLVSPTTLVEGIAGTVVAVRIEKAADADALAKLAEVRHIRAPRPTADTAGPAPAAAPPAADVLTRSNVKALHDRGYKGGGTKVVVLGTEFGGYEKVLPASTRFLDLTDEATITGGPAPANPADKGAGLAAAVAAHAAAPDATLVLVRLDPAGFHQLLSIARATTGDRGLTEGLRSKVDRLTRENETLTDRRRAVMAEYTAAAADLSDDPKSVKRREDAAAAVKRIDADLAALKAASDRLKAIRAGLESLTDAAVVVNTLVWDAGVAGDGLNALQRVLEERFVPPVVTNAIHPGPTARPPVWIQAASGSVGSVWAGPARDADGNGVLEFVPPGTKLPAGTWTPELNFLALVGPNSKGDTLPAGSKVRFTLQWREPQDPELSLVEPYFHFTIRLVKQVDPTGAKAATDELLEVAHSAAEPVRLYKTATSGVYELTLDAAIPADGRYAVRVEYGVSGLKVIRARQVSAEVYPRLVVEPADPATAAKGRTTFATFAPADPGAGVPADSHVAITVGSEESGLTVGGAGPSMGLRTKPDLLARGVIDVGGKPVAGPAVAAGYVAGIAASIRSTGANPATVLKNFESPGTAVVVPKVWLDSIR